MEKTWTVVKFTTDNAVEAVPTTWILGQRCYWPPFSIERLLNSITTHEEPNTCWPLYETVTYRNAIYDTYVMARAKAEYNSNLDLDPPEILSELKRKRCTLSSSDEEDITTILQKPPKMKKVAVGADYDASDVCWDIIHADMALTLGYTSCLCCPLYETDAANGQQEWEEEETILRFLEAADSILPAQ